MNTDILPGDMILGSTTSTENTIEYALTDIKNASLPIKGSIAVSQTAVGQSEEGGLQAAFQALLPTGLKPVLIPGSDALGLGMLIVVDQRFMRAVRTVLEVSGEQVYELGFLLAEEKESSAL